MKIIKQMGGTMGIIIDFYVMMPKRERNNGFFFNADHYFCSPIDHHCRPCEEICDRNRSNYDYARCEAGCQGESFGYYFQMDSFPRKL